MTYCHKQLEDLALRDERSGAVRLQPCKSPVWDTAIAIGAIASAGFDGRSRGGPAAGWILNRQITRPGDWGRTVHAEPGGWCFEYRNDFYPDSTTRPWP